MKIGQTKKINKYFSVTKKASNNFIVRNHFYKTEMKAISMNHASAIINNHLDTKYGKTI